MKSKEWAILIAVVLVVAVAASLITANITGNTIRLNQDRFGKYQVYTKAEVDNLILGSSSNISKTISYLDPTSCNDVYAYNNGNRSDVGVWAECKGGQGIGLVEGVICPGAGYNPRLSGWSRYGDFNYLPGGIYFSCVNSNNNIISPDVIYITCCDIKGAKTDAKSSVKNIIKLDAKGKVIQS